MQGSLKRSIDWLQQFTASRTHISTQLQVMQSHECKSSAEGRAWRRQNSSVKVASTPAKYGIAISSAALGRRGGSISRHA